MVETIVKTLRDDEFAKSQSHIDFKDKAWWEWGFSSNNELYCRGNKSGWLFGEDWHRLDLANLCFISIDFSTMKKLVKEFSDE